MAYDSTTIKGLSLTTPTESTSYVPELNDSDREIKTVLSNQYAFAAKTGTYTLTASDSYITCSGTFTVTLPTPSSVASATYIKEYTIVNIGSGTITITNSASENINGATTDITMLPSYQGLRIWTNGTDWFTEALSNSLVAVSALSSPKTTWP